MFQKIYKILTASIRKKPTFIIIGAQKCGTTSLAYYLSQHRKVFFSKQKELHFFNRIKDFSSSWYKTHFPIDLLGKYQHYGEATPDYILYPQIPGLIKKLNPNTKIIVLLKDPVSRMVSHYKHNLTQKREWLEMTEAFDVEKYRTNPEIVDVETSKYEVVKDFSNYSYKRKGLYAQQLEKWFEVFDDKDIMVINSEKFFESPEIVFNDVTDFLQLDRCSKIDFTARNVSKLSSVMSEEDSKKYLEYFEDDLKELKDRYGIDFESIKS